MPKDSWKDRSKEPKLSQPNCEASEYRRTSAPVQGCHGPDDFPFESEMKILYHSRIETIMLCIVVTLPRAARCHAWTFPMFEGPVTFRLGLLPGGIIGKR